MYLTVDNCFCMKFSLKEKNVVITDMVIVWAIKIRSLLLSPVTQRDSEM